MGTDMPFLWFISGEGSAEILFEFSRKKDDRSLYLPSPSERKTHMNLQYELAILRMASIGNPDHIATLDVYDSKKKIVEKMAIFQREMVFKEKTGLETQRGFVMHSDRYKNKESPVRPTIQDMIEDFEYITGDSIKLMYVDRHTSNGLKYDRFYWKGEKKPKYALVYESEE
jgi:hypothetical protein